MILANDNVDIGFTGENGTVAIHIQGFIAQICGDFNLEKLSDLLGKSLPEIEFYGYPTEMAFVDGVLGHIYLEKESFSNLLLEFGISVGKKESRKILICDIYPDYLERDQKIVDCIANLIPARNKNILVHGMADPRDKFVIPRDIPGKYTHAINTAFNKLSMAYAKAWLYKMSKDYPGMACLAKKFSK